MKAEDLVLDQSCERQVVEKISEVLPHVGVPVFAEALVVEAINLGDLAGLMVSTENRDALGVSNL